MTNEELNILARNYATHSAEVAISIVEFSISKGIDAPQCVALLLSSLAGPLRMIAMATGRDNKISNDGIAFATILAESTLRAVNGGIVLDYSAETVLEAINKFASITGKSPDKMLNSSLMAAARDCESEAKRDADTLLAAIGIRPNKPA